jgi:predicted permease
MAMVGLVLVVAAGNVANLFLARGEARSREIAIRFALGASRWRVLRPLLVESLLLTFTAGGLGLVLARWTTWLAPVLLNVERLPDGVTPAPDLRIAVAVLALSMALGIGIWAASALRAVAGVTLTGIAAQVQSGLRRTFYWRRALVVTQAALSVVLLCGSAVLPRSLIRLMSVDPGFSVDQRYSFWLDPARSGFDPVRSSKILSQVFDALHTIPGVQGISIATQLPLSGRSDPGTFISTDGCTVREGESIGIRIAHASAGHFANLGMAVIAGREFSRDDMNGAKVAVINEAFARKCFGTNDPIGRLLPLEGDRAESRVIGVVKDIKPSPRAPAPLRSYTPYRFRDPGEGETGFAIRVGKGVRVTGEMVRQAVRRVEPSLAIDEFAPMAEQAARALSRDRMVAWVSASFAILAALLCAIGIFGLTSFSVARRTQEIGVRITLGATRASIQWMVMREVLLLSAVGCSIGIVAFFYGGRVLSTMLFDMTPIDPASLATGALILSGTALLAGLVPAYRAALVDPVRTLRQE